MDLFSLLYRLVNCRLDCTEQFENEIKTKENVYAKESAKTMSQSVLHNLPE